MPVHGLPLMSYLPFLKKEISQGQGGAHDQLHRPDTLSLKSSGGNDKPDKGVIYCRERQGEPPRASSDPGGCVPHRDGPDASERWLL